MKSFFDVLYDIADFNGGACSDEEKDFLKKIKPTHSWFDKKEHYESLSKEEREGTLHAWWDNHVWGDGSY